MVRSGIYLGFFFGFFLLRSITGLLLYRVRCGGPAWIIVPRVCTAWKKYVVPETGNRVTGVVKTVIGCVRGGVVYSSETVENCSLTRIIETMTICSILINIYIYIVPFRLFTCKCIKNIKKKLWKNSKITQLKTGRKPITTIRFMTCLFGSTLYTLNRFIDDRSGETLREPNLNMSTAWSSS